MPGGLLNLVAYGNQNLILTGNPSKTFFKCTYAKYTNFGLQRFRLDFDGQRSLRETQSSVLRFKIPRYGDLLMDTYLVITMPTIWSTILPPQDAPTKLGTSTSIEPVIQDYTNVWSPYEFKWIKNLGTQMIKEVKFLVGAQVIQKFTGDYLYALVERDFDEAKKDLYYKMTGNVPELNDPANAYGRNNYYPSAWPTNNPNYVNLGPEPSIRSRKLYIPLNIWFTLASKMAFPLVSLQYNELHIEITLRPMQELFVIRDVETVGDDIRPTRGVPIGNYIQPNFNNQLHQMYRFLQPPPDPATTPNATKYNDLKDIVKSDYYVDQRTNWACDTHLISTYAFLSDEEVKVFALQPQNYLIKEVYYTEFKNVVGTQKVSLETAGLVSNWMWYLQRTDAFLRNEWSNYTNWPYDVLPNNLVDPLDYVDIPDNSLPSNAYEYYNQINIILKNKTADDNNADNNNNGLQDLEGTYTLISPISDFNSHHGVWMTPAMYKNDDIDVTIVEKFLIENEILSEIPHYEFTDPQGITFTTYWDEESQHYTFNVQSSDENEENGIEQQYLMSITPTDPKKVYVPPPPIGKAVSVPNLCSKDGIDPRIVQKQNGMTTDGSFNSDDWWNTPDTIQNCAVTPSYNPWYLQTISNPKTNTKTETIYPNLPYYKTDLRITGDFDSGNQKDIMITWALIMDGKYRETELDAGVLNYVEKYVRTSGNAPDGLYCYNFGLQSSPFDFQPSGAINLSKFRTVEFEISTFAPPSDPNAETLTICDSDGNIVGVNKPVWRVYDYTYNLVVMEERYNVVKFISGNAALAYAR